MNKERRQQLYDAVSLLDDAIAVIQDVHAEEEEAFENLPEGLQGSQTGYNMQLAMEKLEYFENRIESIKDEIEDYSNCKKK